jgi:hypothetical protein
VCDDIIFATGLPGRIGIVGHPENPIYLIGRMLFRRLLGVPDRRNCR